ncbi:MAG: HAD family hydrolase, partial [Steroidobacteraceae bacterium]
RPSDRGPSVTEAARARASTCAVNDAQIRFVLFDAGNTLLHLDYAAIAAVIERHGRRVSALDVQKAEYEAKAFIDRRLGPHGDPPRSLEGILWQADHPERPSYFATVCHALGVPRDATAPIVAELSQQNRENCLWRVVEDDTQNVLGALQERGYRLGVISNSDGRIEAELIRGGVARFLDVVVDSHVVGVEKPHPAIFEHALAALSCRPEAAIYVGDVFGIDVLGARRAGLHPVLIDPLGCYPGELDCPRIRRLRELLDLLAPIASGRTT